MDLGTIHHVAINAENYELTKDFYVNKLGFQVLGEYTFNGNTKRMDCQMGGTRLEIFQLLKAEKRSTEANLGYRHLCFKATDIEKTVAELKALGVAVQDIRVDPMAGGRLAFFTDPEGLVLELHE